MAEKKQANSRAQKLRKEFADRFEKTLDEMHKWAEEHSRDGVAMVVRVGIHEKDGRDLGYYSCISREFVDPKVRAMIEVMKDKSGALVMGVMFLERLIHTLTPDGIIGMGLGPLGPVGLGRMLADLKAAGKKKQEQKPIEKKTA